MIKKAIFILFLFHMTHAQNWLGYINQFNPTPNYAEMGMVSRQSTMTTTRQQQELDSSETEYLYPCNGEIVQMTRPGGQLTHQTNYWDGRVDLTDYTYLKAIKLVIRVDQAGQITIDPEKGSISGPSTGKIFRVTFYGAPPEVNEVHFHIKGLQGTLFPNLVSLHLNNREICKNPTSVIDNLAGTISDLGNAGEQITGLGGLTGNLGIGGLFGSSGNNFNTVSRPTTRTTRRPTTTTTRKVSSVTCGRRQITQSAYITNGYEVRPGDYPWHAALYHKGSRSSSYKCGGTLINKQTVITAAHCLYSNGRQIVPEKVSIQLGKHNLNIFDAHTVEYQVFKLIIHPEYSSVDLQDDLALVRLETLVEYTQYIFPACLWKAEKKSLDNVVGRKGHVVGWGLTEDDGLAEVLNAGTMPVVGFLECLESDRDFFGPFLSDFNYCAGYRNGTSVCNGDSGGGMFFQENGLWTLRGLVSFSSVREDRDVCNPENFVIFTDVAKYLDWIEKNM